MLSFDLPSLIEGGCQNLRCAADCGKYTHVSVIAQAVSVQAAVRELEAPRVAALRHADQHLAEVALARVCAQNELDTLARTT